MPDPTPGDKAGGYGPDLTAALLTAACRFADKYLAPGQAPSLACRTTPPTSWPEMLTITLNDGREVKLPLFPWWDGDMWQDD